MVREFMDPDKKWEVIKVIFKEGVPLDVPLNDIGENALILFTMAKNRQGIKQMLDWGANINATTCINRTALHYIVRVDETGELTKWLLSHEKVKKKCDVNAQTIGRETPLMLAVKCGNAKAVEELLNAGANPWIKNNLDQQASDYKTEVGVANIAASQIIDMLLKAKSNWLKNGMQFIPNNG